MHFIRLKLTCGDEVVSDNFYPDLHNTSDQPALMLRVKPVREKSGDRILPALSSDNYVALMPGERRTIRTELENADTRGERPRIVVEGFNIQ